jgi:hypothetical protein
MSEFTQKQQEVRFAALENGSLIEQYLDKKPEHHCSITALGLECWGYQFKHFSASFQRDGKVFYAGQGAGLEGDRVGEVPLEPLWNLLRLLAESDVETFAEDYQWHGAEFIYNEGVYNIISTLTIHSGNQQKVIRSCDGAGPGVVVVAITLLDFLLDQAVWEGAPFKLDRTAVAPPQEKRRRQKR